MQAVARNRDLLVASARLPQMPVWLEQVHGTHVLRLEGQPLADLRVNACCVLAYRLFAAVAAVRLEK